MTEHTEVDEHTGTATTGPGPPPAVTSRAIASATDGLDNSMNPPSTAGTRPVARSRTIPASRVNSATPASLRVPWPTMSRGGVVTMLVPWAGWWGRD